MSFYRGRLAPSPTGLLHMGHARTFWTAFQRARQGVLVLRNEDIDQARSRPQFVEAFMEDLQWLGIHWQEGPFHQSQRFPLYQEALEKVRRSGFLYPCTCSRKDIQAAITAPHQDEPIYPGLCRDRAAHPDLQACWRFRVPDGENVEFLDAALGPQSFQAGHDFGDFVVWRQGAPSYQLACVVDDAAMEITEVVRGADLLMSTARQILLFRALEKTPPSFFHCPLVADETGKRLSKRHDSLSLRHLRESGKTPQELLREFS